MRRIRRNRRRLGPFWRRLPSPRAGARALWHAIWHALWRGMRRGLPAIAVASAAALLFCSGYWAYRVVTSSPHFAVAAIEVEGNQSLTDAEVQAHIGLDPAYRYNLFRLDLDAIEDALETDPWIAHAHARRKLPDTLIVEIAEHQPAALVEMDGLYLADAGGLVFARALTERGHGRGLPVITGISREQYVGSPEAAQAAIHRALEAAQLYTGGSSETPRPRLGEIHIDPRRGITFFTYDNATAVRIGRGSLDTLHARLRAFDEAWQALVPEERARVRVVYADTSPRPDRITVGFEENR